MKKLKGMDSIGSLTDLHHAFKFFITKHDFEFVDKMMLQFNEKSSNSELKTILIITKGLESSVVQKNRQRIKDILKSKMEEKFI